jgi:hypothetical protein
MHIPEYVRRELSEVYLLMDHIAGRQDKSLSAALAPAGTAGNGITLEDLCAVPWPVPEQDRGKTLALVLTAKDRLSHAAYPATGYTIAFTYLSASLEAGAPSVGALRRAASYLKHRLSDRGASLSPALSEPAADEDAGSERSSGANAPTIVQFAHDAFRGLERKRGWLRKTIRWLMALLALLLAGTCSVTWDLAMGQRLLADGKWLAQHPDAMQPYPDTRELAKFCPTLETVATPSAPEASGKVTQASETGPLEDRARADLRVLPMLETWNGRQFWLSWLISSPDTRLAHCEGNIKELSRVLATTLNYNVLPLLLGALAASAAAIRTISRKVRGNELAPRDLLLIWPRVALGAFLGVVIGLLIAPGASNGLFTLAGTAGPHGTAVGAAGAATTSDAVALSPAAYAFLAGFATDRIFQWLDNLIDRIFYLPSLRP